MIGAGLRRGCGPSERGPPRAVHSARMRRAQVPVELTAKPFTAAQARACGLSPAQLRSGAYRRLFHNVYVDRRLRDCVELRAAAVRLVLPDDAVVGYTAAAWLHGADVRDPRRPDVEIIGQRGDQIRRRGVAATSALLQAEDVTEVLGIAVTTPVRTAFDLARCEDLIRAVVGIDAMLNRGGCDLVELAAYTASHRKWRWVRTVDQALKHAEPLSQSPMETVQRMRLVLAGLPRPRAQAPVVDANGHAFAYVDNGYEEYRVGADYDGEHHRDQWRHDLERQERIRDRGWWHRRYTSLHIRSGWQQMVDQVARALLAAGWRPPASA